MTNNNIGTIYKEYQFSDKKEDKISFKIKNLTKWFALCNDKHYPDFQHKAKRISLNEYRKMMGY